MTKIDVVREYRTKYPSYPSKKLARIIYSREGLLFTSEETIRKMIGKIEGKGDNKTKATHECATRPYNPYKLPESDESTFQPFVLTGHKRVLGLFDIHAPYHSISAITAALDFAKKEKPDAIIIGGDLFDFHGLSKYMKDPRKKNFSDEITAGTDLIKAIQATIKAPIYYKLGNHDERYQHYLWMKAGELNGVEDFELSTIVKKRISDITIIDEKRIIKAGDLNIVHGHEFASSIISPVNIARGLYLRAKASSICGHHHRTSEHTEQDINGKIVTTWSVGCLSELHPQYMPINSWNHGFCMIDISGDDFEVRNKRIWKGQIL
jgi:predicted phosphodiesterase